MAPLAPGRLSMITYTPNARVRIGAITRGSKSAVPPGGNGTTMVMGRDGKLGGCAAAGKPVSAASIVNAGMAKFNTLLMFFLVMIVSVMNCFISEVLFAFDCTMAHRQRPFSVPLSRRHRVKCPGL